MYMNLEKNMCRELEALEEKYRNGAEMSEGDLRRIDLLVHSLKSMATYKAMKQAEGYDNNDYQGNNSYNGSYNNSYNNSYMNNSYNRNMHDGRYSRDMEQSGHYPMNYPMYPEERRW